MMKRILTTLCLLAALRASASDPWWTEDVWSKPDRPFLYYGEGNPAETNKPEEAPVREAEPEPEPDPDDFSRFTTREALRAEYERRFDRALLAPTEANVASLQAATAHFFTLAQRFGEAWERTRIGRPEYDWTAGRSGSGELVPPMRAMTLSSSWTVSLMTRPFHQSTRLTSSPSMS